MRKKPTHSSLVTGARAFSRRRIRVTAVLQTPGGQAFALVLGLILFHAAPARALEPDQLVLIVNSNVPAGRQLAEHYAQVRHVPDGRILELSLPTQSADVPADDISPTDFDQKVRPAVRKFLSANGLDRKVTCLVTFWGVPLRIDRRVFGDLQSRELKNLKQELDALLPQLQAQVQAAEALGQRVDPAFKPATENNLDALGRRAQGALSLLVQKLPGVDPKTRGEIYPKLLAAIQQIAGQPTYAQILTSPPLLAIAPQLPAMADVQAARQRSEEINARLEAIASLPENADSRQRLRDAFGADMGSLPTARLIVAQINASDTTESESAFDSELALLWWPPYPKAKWQANMLYWKIAALPHPPLRMLMVTRLDGPSVNKVRELIDTSVQVELHGLQGEVVIDARGKPPTEPYGLYDQTLRNLAVMLKDHANLPVVLDNQEPLIPADSQRNIAIYCGWYSLRHYVSPGTFSPGAVAMHIASLEMLTLHNPGETGWCRNLLEAGAAATIGPVAEPYLQSFPPADEFFPLLMTGKMQLAEVYWATSPWSSWMQCCVGDPLYTPYKINPPLKVADLPENLRKAIPE